MNDRLAAHLAATCSRSALHAEAFFQLREAFPECKLLRLSFGLRNKVMLSITVDLDQQGRTHASYIPIHPTAAAAAVLQNSPVVVVRQDKRCPLWDQEDLYQREGCSVLSVVSMPFFWPPHAGSQWNGTPLKVPRNAAFHPTFGALTAAGNKTLTQDAMHALLDLASRTGHHVGAHISMLLSSLEAAELLPSEADAQEELGSGKEDPLSEGEESGEDLFGFDVAQHLVTGIETDDLLPGLGPPPTHANPGIPCCPQQKPQQQEPRLPWMAADREGTGGEGNGPTAASGAGPSASHRTRPSSAPARQQQYGVPPPRCGRLGGQAQAPVAQGAGRTLPGPMRAAGRRGHAPLPPSPLPSHSIAAAPSMQPPPAGRPAVAAPRPSTPSRLTHTGVPPAPAGASRRAARGIPGLSRKAARQAAAAATWAASCRASGHGGSSRGAKPSTRFPWHNMSFQAEGVERAFVAHYGRSREQADLAALLLLLLGLLAAAVARLQATWPAGVAAMLLFTPYFFDSRLYQIQRERLVSAILVLVSVFLASLQPRLMSLSAPDATCANVTNAAWAATCSCAPSAAHTHRLAGFGIFWFVLHTCGLHYLMAVPMLLRLRVNGALMVQGSSLAMALYRLPRAYTALMGHLDTVHVLFLSVVLAASTLAALMVCQAQEQRQRDAWLERQVRRGKNIPAGMHLTNSITVGASPMPVYP